MPNNSLGFRRWYAPQRDLVRGMYSLGGCYTPVNRENRTADKSPASLTTTTKSFNGIFEVDLLISRLL